MCAESWGCSNSMGGRGCVHLFGFWEEVLLEGDAELLLQWGELGEVLLVLALVLDLGLDTCWGVSVCHSGNLRGARLSPSLRYIRSYFDNGGGYGERG